MGIDVKNSIRRNRKYLDRCLSSAGRLVKQKHYETAARYMQGLALFAWGNTTGYYVNWRLERLLNILGRTIPAPDIRYQQLNAGSKKLKILHIATELYEIGGHTSLMVNWINNDTNNIHSVVVTNQINEFPISLTSQLNSIQFEILETADSFLKRAESVRKKAALFDLIILHIHPHDVIPVIALSTSNIPPIGFLNHADHCFWVGASIADMLIQINEPNIEIDKKRRKIKDQIFLPIITSAEKGENNHKEKTINNLHLFNENIILLSVGSSYKYKPFKDLNLFENIIPVLDSNPKAILFIAGIGCEDKMVKSYKHERINYLGTIPKHELEEYEQACNIYVEGYPFGSFTAMLQVSKKRKPIQLMPKPYPVTKLFNNNNNNACLRYPESIQEWRVNLNRLITDITFRNYVAEEQSKAINEIYDLNLWKTKIRTLYRLLLDKKHSVKSFKKNIFYNTDNEHILRSMDRNFSIDHFDHSHELNSFGRLKHVLAAFNKPSLIGGKNKKQTLKYLLKM